MATQQLQNEVEQLRQQLASLEVKVSNLVDLLVEQAPAVEKRLHIKLNKAQAENAELRNRLNFEMYDTQEAQRFRPNI